MERQIESVIDPSPRAIRDGGGIPWVAASGCRGITQLKLAMKIEPDREAGAAFTIRLHFADPDNDRPGQRTFDVLIQDKPVLTGFDIAKETGGRNRALVKEFKGVMIRDRLLLRFVPADPNRSTPASVPLLCGVELVKEE